MIINNTKQIRRISAKLIPVDEEIIKVYMLGAVDAFCNVKPDEPFSARILFGGNNRNWNGTPAVDDMMFEKMVELGSTKGCFAGHDHMNNFSVMKDGIRLTYGLSDDHNIYVVPFRGGVLINIKDDGSFTTQHLIRHRGQSTVTIGKEQ